MATCLVCSTDMHPLFAARDYRRPADETVRAVFWCDRCRYGKVGGDFTPAKVSAFYVSNYYTHASGDQAQDAPSFLDRLRVRLAWAVDRSVPLHATEVAGKTMCDVGCGNGDNMRRFAAHGFEVTGVEPDPAARAVAGAAFEGTAENLPPLPRFDVVMMLHVLEHTINPASALRNMRGLLNPGGTLVVEVPNNAAIAFRQFAEYWPWSDIPRHLHFFTEASLGAALAAAGFKVQRVMYDGYVRQFTPGWIETQKDIWRSIGPQGARMPSFSREAWRLLARTAFSSTARKYDSVRIHAVVA